MRSCLDAGYKAAQLVKHPRQTFREIIHLVGETGRTALRDFGAEITLANALRHAAELGELRAEHAREQCTNRRA